jgi:hypothetical protein
MVPQVKQFICGGRQSSKQRIAAILRAAGLKINPVEGERLLLVVFNRKAVPSPGPRRAAKKSRPRR